VAPPVIRDLIECVSIHIGQRYGAISKEALSHASLSMSGVSVALGMRLSPVRDHLFYVSMIRDRKGLPLFGNQGAFMRLPKPETWRLAHVTKSLSP
jgi:hypothetical protein